MLTSDNSSERYYYYPNFTQYLANALNRHFLGGNVLGEEFVVRLEEPRFISTFSYDNECTLYDAVAQSEIMIDDCIFYNVQWLDFEPDEEEKMDLFCEARDVIGFYFSPKG